MQAYGFVALNYASADTIHLVGFSRGAFTARCVAQLMNDIGLLKKSGLKELRKLFNLWKDRQQDHLRILLNRIRSANQLWPNVRIDTCTVWDTVSSFGLPGSRLIARSPQRKLNFVNSELCNNIDHAFQALSLSERRWNYQPILWKTPPTNSNQSLKQCWFLGFHSDIGGGNEKGMPFAYITIFWIIDQLKSRLQFDVQNLTDVSANHPSLECPELNDYKARRPRFGTCEFKFSNPPVFGA